MTEERVLVTGANGHLGRGLIRRLAREGATPVRAVVRSQRAADVLRGLPESVRPEIAVLDYNTEHSHAYAYRLSDDSPWVDLGPRHAITFTDLDPGSYAFSVRGRNCQGVWSDARPTLRLRVVPPFWMSAWFRMTAVLVLFSVAVIGHRVRVKFREEYE